MLTIACYVELAVCWIAWTLAFVKPRKRAAGAKKNVTAPVSRWGIFLVMLGYACIWAFVRPVGFEKSAASLIASMMIAPPSVVLVWMATRSSVERGPQADYDGTVSVAAESDLRIDAGDVAGYRICEDMVAASSCGSDLLPDRN